MLLQPKPLVLTVDGAPKTFILSKFPAVQGREIVAKYPVANMPKIGDYGVSEETMLKLMCFVAVDLGTGAPLVLTTKDLVNNHAGDWETLARLEWAMMEYNVSFFANGGLSTFLAKSKETLPTLISKMLTGFLDQSLAPASPPSTN